MAIQIGYLVGGLSRGSINRRLAHALIGLAPDDLAFNEIPIADLPLYSQDMDDEFPPAAVALKEAIASSGGLLIVTPEYNRSIPGALKNALDWASRPYGSNALAGIPSGVIGASVGSTGTALSQQHLRNVLAYLDSPTLQQPEAFIHFTPQRFAEDGSILDDRTREFLTAWMSAFAAWVRILRDRPRT
ncbi:NADPH-dependent FMN reductase [Streptomyces sp. SYSU K217416]